MKKIKSIFGFAFCLLVLASSCTGFTRYNGEQHLEDKHFYGLEIHGAAQLHRVTVDENVLINGSTEATNIKVRGHLTIRGALDINEGTIGKDAKISGKVVAKKLKLNGELFTHATIDANDCDFQDITVQSDENRTLRFTKSHFKKLTINGAGNKIVILKDSTAQAIIFENKGGLVKNSNSGTFIIENGTVE